MKNAMVLMLPWLAACAAGGRPSARFDAAASGRDALVAGPDATEMEDASTSTSDAFVREVDAAVGTSDAFVVIERDAFVPAFDAFERPVDAHVAPDAFVGTDAAATAVVACSTAAICSGHLVISEVATHGQSSATDEFVEVENTSTSPLDISGVELLYYSAAGTASHRATAQPGIVISPGGFALFASTTFTDLAPDVTERWSQGLADAGGTVELRVGVTAIDRFGWGTATVFDASPYTPATTAGDGSYERKALASSTPSSMSAGGADEHAGNRYDSDRDASDFVTRTSRDPANLVTAPE